MIDTLNGYLDMRTYTGDPKRTLKLLDDVKEEYLLKGRKGNIRFIIKKNRIRFFGSLCKYYFGNNLKTLGRSDILEGLQRLSDETGINIMDATITRIDIGENFPVKHTPKSYYPYLSECPYLDRLIQPSSLSYQNASGKLIHYDKFKQVKRQELKNLALSMFGTKNIYRYEMQRFKNTKAFFNQSDFTVKDLCKPETMDFMVDKYIETYGKITKIKQPFIEPPKRATPKQIDSYELACHWLGMGQEKAFQEFYYLKDNKTFKTASQASNYKGKLRKLFSKPDIVDSPLIEELNKKILSVRDTFK